MQQNEKVLRMIGLARKAGKAVGGETETENAVRSGKAFLVFVAEDASDNTKKHFSDKCAYYKVPVRCLATKEELGKATGAAFRSSVAVCDPGFAEAIGKLLNMSGGKRIET